jgi:hypothetical protein
LISRHLRPFRDGTAAARADVRPLSHCMNSGVQGDRMEAFPSARRQDAASPAGRMPAFLSHGSGMPVFLSRPTSVTRSCRSARSQCG